MKSLTFAFSGLLLLILAGCTTYYSVTDPTTGKTFYTTSDSLDQNNSGAASFIDARTGDKVTLQNSAVGKITEQQFESGKSGVAPSTQPS